MPKQTEEDEGTGAEGKGESVRCTREGADRRARKFGVREGRGAVRKLGKRRIWVRGGDG
tara:strand:+ start:14110 stop:14286 length:177 start_codon:yes stop_codon:yes gene_type:complete